MNSRLLPIVQEKKAKFAERNQKFRCSTYNLGFHLAIAFEDHTMQMIEQHNLFTKYVRLQLAYSSTCVCNQICFTMQENHFKKPTWYNHFPSLSVPFIFKSYVFNKMNSLSFLDA